MNIAYKNSITGPIPILPVIQSDIDTLRKIADNIGEMSLTESLAELSDKLATNRFYFVVVGLFKRGKSSLINALLGKELAPVAVTPLTSVITFFEYGLSTTAEVVFNNNCRVFIEIPEIAEYVAEENNPKNRKQVQYVRICTNAPVLENIVLVDTPGLGSLFSQNNDTTMNFLPRIDAALFVLSTDVPISKFDEIFLREIRQSIPDILFVLNKSDMLTHAELYKMINYNKQMLYEIFNDSNQETDIELIPVSARNYFIGNPQKEIHNQDNISKLFEKINSRIVNSRDKILITRSINRLLSAIHQLKTLLTVKSETLKLPVYKLEQKRESMQRSIDYFTSGKNDFEAVIENRIGQLTDYVTKTTEQKRIELTAYCHDILIEKATQTWKEIINSDADIYSRKICEYITQQFEELKSNLEQSVKDEFSSIILQYSGQSQSFLYEIIRKMQQILGVQIESIISSFDLDVCTSFYLLIGDIKYTIPSVKKKLIYRLLPDSMIRGIVLKQIYVNCLEIINPNTGRIRSDIDYKIRESYRKFKNHFDKKLYELLLSLKSIIEESIKSKLSITENIEKLFAQTHQQQQTVDEIKITILEK